MKRVDSLRSEMIKIHESYVRECPTDGRYCKTIKVRGKPRQVCTLYKTDVKRGEYNFICELLSEETVRIGVGVGRKGHHTGQLEMKTFYICNGPSD